MKRTDTRYAYLLLLPALTPVVILSVFPLLRGIYLGFTDARAGRNAQTHFTGLTNYRELVSDSQFWQAFRIGLVWAFGVTVLQFLLDELLYRTGLDSARHNWLGDFNTALPAVIAVGVWAGMPQTTVVLLAGQQGVPRELHEAAAVDGAAAWQSKATGTPYTTSC